MWATPFVQLSTSFAASAFRATIPATHLLHAALRQVLGDHVKQAGSYVGPDRLRFDFTHFEGVTPEQLAEVERVANEQIMNAVPMSTYETSLDAAREIGRHGSIWREVRRYRARR